MAIDAYSALLPAIPSSGESVQMCLPMEILTSTHVQIASPIVQRTAPAMNWSQASAPTVVNLVSFLTYEVVQPRMSYDEKARP